MVSFLKLTYLIQLILRVVICAWYIFKEMSNKMKNSGNFLWCCRIIWASTNTLSPTIHWLLAVKRHLLTLNPYLFIYFLYFRYVCFKAFSMDRMTSFFDLFIARIEGLRHWWNPSCMFTGDIWESPATIWVHSTHSLTAQKHKWTMHHGLTGYWSLSVCPASLQSW